MRSLFFQCSADDRIGVRFVAHFSSHVKNIFMKHFDYYHAIRMPPWIGHKLIQSQETNIYGSGDETIPRPIHFQDNNPQDQIYQAKPQHESIYSNVHGETPTFRRYRIMTDFMLIGRM